MTLQNLSRSLVVIGLFAVLGHAQEAQLLTPGKTIEREIASGQSHVYRIALTAGQFVHVTVEQLSCDVTLTLTTPDGKQAVKANLASRVCAKLCRKKRR